MMLRGTSMIGFGRASGRGATFFAHDPRTGARHEPAFRVAVSADVDEACRLASVAFDARAHWDTEARASLLRAIADGLEAHASAICKRAEAETALARQRLDSELVRTCRQLVLFADVVAEGSWVDARIDTDEWRRPMPRPDIRSMRVPLGPVAVFGASNFPLAFSVAGGDTASALAAGNPVIVKAHPAHPGTSELVGTVVGDAVRRQGFPEGTFSLLFDDGFAVAEALVRHPAVRAVAFTGSRGGGTAIAQLGAARPDPIPVFAEMGSVNPILVLPEAARERAQSIAAGLHLSFTLGAGQYCTNPGVVLLPEGADGDAVSESLAELTRATPAATMLTAATSAAYRRGLDRLQQCGARLVAGGALGTGGAPAQATLWHAEFRDALVEPRLLGEVFGPATLILRYPDFDALLRFVRALEGQLSLSLHATDAEMTASSALVDALVAKAGRVVFNQFPTGVEVVPAMVHGGPFPASSDERTTSVGTRAIERFTRLVAFQNAGAHVLPPELRDENPCGIWRLVNGSWTPNAVSKASRP
jgi:NADP-dependent aldehyde dehydrogenase